MQYMNIYKPVHALIVKIFVFVRSDQTSLQVSSVENSTSPEAGKSTII